MTNTREIKFRAWDNKMNRLIDVDLMMGRCDLGNALNNKEVYKDWHVMQFTGLEDKNGKEIYEGDKLKTDDNNVFEVEFDSGCFVGFDYKNRRRCPLEEFCDEVKISGNIYEK